MVAPRVWARQTGLLEPKDACGRVVAHSEVTSPIAQSGDYSREFEISTNHELQRFGIPANLLCHSFQLFKHWSDGGKGDSYRKPAVGFTCDPFHGPWCVCGHVNWRMGLLNWFQTDEGLRYLVTGAFELYRVFCPNRF